MKCYVLTIALFLCPFIAAQANILNGFQRQKQILENQINRNEALLKGESDDKTISQIKKSIKRFQKKYALVSKKYAATKELLAATKPIDPELFTLVSNITNAEGTLTHVYVQYVSRVSKEYIYYSRNHFTADAYTSVSQSKDNKHVCTSLNGTNTITITIGYGCDGKMALGHEFAHVLYIVPNLSKYLDYWNRSDDFCSGHSLDDPSYRFLETIEGNFKIRYNKYLKGEKIKRSSKLYLASNKENQ